MDFIDSEVCKLYTECSLNCVCVYVCTRACVSAYIFS